MFFGWSTAPCGANHRRVADVGRLDSVNVGRPVPNPYKETRATGIDKRAYDGPVEVRDPGPKRSGLGSGIPGDYIGDARHHGGSDQALYAVAREDLDVWSDRLGRPLPNGFFGENLTLTRLDPNEARLGERWRIGAEVEVVVTSPRVPCSTFRGWVGERGWLKTFVAEARPGAYLRIVTPGVIRAGDEVTVVHRPAHDVTVSLTLRALLTEPDLLPLLAAAGDDLLPELRARL